MSSEGKLGNLGEPAVSLSRLPEEEGYRVTKSPGVDGRASAPSTSRKEHKARKQTRYREASASEATRDGQLAVVAEHSTEGRWGTKAQATHWREGDAGHTVRLGGTDGRYFEITNRLNATPADCRAGKAVSRDGLYDAGSSDGRGLSARGVSPHAQGQRTGDRRGDGSGVCRAPGRELAATCTSGCAAGGITRRR